MKGMLFIVPESQLKMEKMAGWGIWIITASYTLLQQTTLSESKQPPEAVSKPATSAALVHCVGRRGQHQEIWATISLEETRREGALPLLLLTLSGSYVGIPTTAG